MPIVPDGIKLLASYLEFCRVRLTAIMLIIAAAATKPEASFHENIDFLLTAGIYGWWIVACWASNAARLGNMLSTILNGGTTLYNKLSSAERVWSCSKDAAQSGQCEICARKPISSAAVK